MGEGSNIFSSHFYQQLSTDIEYIREDNDRKVQSEKAINYPKTNLANFIQRQFAPVLVGELRLRKIMEDLVKMFYPHNRYRFQEILHKEVLRSVLNCVVDREEERRMVMPRILETYGWESQTRNALTVASRRSGKTTGLAAVIAAVLLHCPGIEVMAFSVSQAGAEEFIRLVYFYMTKIVGKAKRVMFSTEAIRVLHPSGDVSRIRCRGTGGVAAKV
jgi:hypothetical protein